MHGGDLLAEVLVAQGVETVFCLSGGHISPILVGCKSRQIRVIDVRHEVTAVFAADATSRLMGTPGVAVVTAGPGLTNTITAVKNAQLAQSPVVILGGATATALKGRGALQDIDQMALFKPHVKWAKAVTKVKDLAPALENAFFKAQNGVPGPVFLECPIDLLYEEKLVRDLYGTKSMSGKKLVSRLLNWYLQWHVKNLFAAVDWNFKARKQARTEMRPQSSSIKKAQKKLAAAKKPLLLIGSQALLQAEKKQLIAEAANQIGIPVYLSGMARGLLGRENELHLRHKRRLALKDADLVILAGVPCDFRLDYGQHIRRSSYLISANRSRIDLRKNRRPNLGIQCDAGEFLLDLAKLGVNSSAWGDWHAQLKKQDEHRENEIIKQSEIQTDLINPLLLCKEIEKLLAPESIIVADGGDFVGTASYVLRPRGPLTWLDPGAFGTLGVGAGFGLGAKLQNPDAVVWLIFGDGSVGYSLSEFDTFVRHKIPVIAVVGNDASWAQIAREQVEMLGDDVATVLARSDYHKVVEGFGARGFLLNKAWEIPDILQQAQKAATAGKPVLINVHLSKSDFRKGSISV
ncbi:MAG: thiamine pyrophosphate-binding protein [Calditrichaeota bacterium]|nr:MAG: thiamine pyrophosphate-binding protein [Calditrichota bacterium]